MNKNPINQYTGTILNQSFYILLIVNSLVIFVAHLLFPNHVVLGTQHFSLAWAIFHSQLVLALLNTLAIPMIREFENGQAKMLSPRGWMLFYFLINFAGLWVITRFSQQFGLGVSSWVVIAILAAVLDFVQGLAMMTLESSRQK